MTAAHRQLDSVAAWTAGLLIVVRDGCRAAGYWLLAGLLGAVAVLTFAVCASLHARGASLLPTAEILAPRFLLARHGSVFLLLAFVVALPLFVGLHHRERRTGIAEALDVKPHATATVFGRACGMTLLLWGLIAAIAVGVQALAAWYGDAMGGGALMAFVFFDVVPAAFLWCAAVALLSIPALGVWLALAVGALTLGAYAWALSSTPAPMLPAVSAVSIHGAFAAQVPADVVWLRRAVMLAVAFGLLLAAAGANRRGDHRRRTVLLAGVLCAAVGIASGGGAAYLAGGELARRDQWLQAHRASGGLAPMDIEHMKVRVEISPETGLDVALEVRLRRAGARGPPALLLSLNPGLRVAQVTLGGTAPSYSWQDGLLTIALANELRQGDTLKLSMRYTGVPDPAFGHLDPVLDWRDETSRGVLALLGREVSIFEPRFVALMPAARWLPSLGPNLDLADLDGSKDFRSIDLAVRVPAAWRVAGPGGLAVRDAKGWFRFQPAVSVSDVALIAAPFAHRTTSVAGVPVELLLGAEDAHQTAIGGLVPIAHDELEALLQDAAELGLPYPFEGLTLVAVPARLRGFAGGWRLAAANALPGIVLLRADCWRAHRRTEKRISKDGDAVDAVKACLRNNATGASPYAAIARQVFPLLVRAHGEGATAIDALTDELLRRLLVPDVHDFSAHDLQDATELRTLALAVAEESLRAEWTSPTAVVGLPDAGPDVWELAARTTLIDLDPASDARLALAVLRHKVRVAADLMIDVLGRDGVAAILADLRVGFSGRSYLAQAFLDQVAVADASLGEYLHGWLRDPGLPGFRISAASVYALPDEPSGAPRWQTTFDVENGEDTPGYVRFRYGASVWPGAMAWNESAPTFVPARSAIEVGLVGRMNPTDLFVDSYLSLNKGPVHVDLDHGLERFPTTHEAFVGTRPSHWSAATDRDGVIVDDLDTEFVALGEQDDPLAVTVRADLPAWRPPSAEQAFALWRQGLPGTAAALADRVRALAELADGDVTTFGWVRQSQPSAWGRYRRTVARARAGAGSAKVAFVAHLPRAGRWALEYHLPDFSVAVPPDPRGADAAFRLQPAGQQEQGSYDIAVVTKSKRLPAVFDGALAVRGWNVLGTFDLTGGKVAVVVSDNSNGRTVFADAIRWRRVEEAM